MPAARKSRIRKQIRRWLGEGDRGKQGQPRSKAEYLRPVSKRNPPADRSAYEQKSTSQGEEL